MHVQIRAQNKYLSGNWSKPLTIPLDDECGKPILKNISGEIYNINKLSINLRVNYEVKITYFSGITTIFPSVTTNIVPSTGSLNFRLYMHNYVVQMIKYKNNRKHVFK